MGTPFFPRGSDKVRDATAALAFGPRLPSGICILLSISTNHAFCRRRRLASSLSRLPFGSVFDRGPCLTSVLARLLRRRETHYKNDARRRQGD